MMVVRFGIEPARFFAMTVRQFNALCHYASREERRSREERMIEEMRHSLSAEVTRKW